LFLDILKSCCGFNQVAEQSFNKSNTIECEWLNEYHRQLKVINLFSALVSKEVNIFTEKEEKNMLKY